ncbi:hypothetical protein T4D_8281 [Trichinella pseudospiralis]|uniref:Uncharacterized protein n=1 Tax=Trichinella pseudospiralis TaxID=6337 RepID=A0A0V1FAI2_TRIPS|nr:hypothetical protein T4D_8281 [Trichinella pseudospiralis]
MSQLENDKKQTIQAFAKLANRRQRSQARYLSLLESVSLPASIVKISHDDETALAFFPFFQKGQLGRLLILVKKLPILRMADKAEGCQAMRK